MRHLNYLQAIAVSFIDLPLDLELIESLAAQTFNEPTKIQSAAIPVIMDGQDLLASAPTGTGKTLAFALPAVQHLLDTQEQHHMTDSPQILVLSPTRELAKQTQEVFTALMQGSALTTNLIVGGVNIGQQHATLMEAKQRNCLVATPGRLLEMLEKGWLDITQVDMLIIDEADRMLDLGFIDTINKIAVLLPKDRQTLMFSATLEGDKMQNFASQLLNSEATQISIGGPRQLAENLKQSVFQADHDEHKELLARALIRSHEIKQAIVFVNSRHQLDKWLAIVRTLGVRCTGLHGELRQSERNQQIKDLRRGRTKILVATDVACRGLDIPNVSHVINLYMPAKADTYVHRAGRSGRDGSIGTVWSVADAMDWPHMARIERYLGEAIPRQIFPGFAAKKPEPSGKPSAKAIADKKAKKKAKKKAGARTATKKSPEKAKTRDRAIKNKGKPKAD